MIKYTKLFIWVLFIGLGSCKFGPSKKEYMIQDYVNQSDYKLIDSSKYVTFHEFIKGYDTIPVNFGYQIFNNIINRIPIDSCRFRRIWTWDIDTIEQVRAIKTNIRLDPKREFSDDTYFFIIEFISHDSMRISATIYMDLRREEIGTYILSRDSLKYARLDNDGIKIKGLNDKLKMHRH